MNVKQHMLLLLILGMLGVSACHWFEEDPPKEEKIKAKGIFDIYINGELFDLNSIDLFRPNPDIGYTEFSGTLRVFAKNEDAGQWLNFAIGSIKDTVIKNVAWGELLYIHEKSCDLPRDYVLLKDGKDYLQLTKLDKENDIIVGEFGFSLIDTCALDTIYVEGIFDEHYTL